MFTNDIDNLDQHFLIDENIINLFYKTIDVKDDDIILEIGPGKGTLTKLIVNKCKKLIVVEKDIRLKEYLDDIDNINVIYDDILNYQIPKVNKIVTSLPYFITEPFMYKLLDCSFDKLILISGKKLYENIINNTKLGILINSYFDVKYISDIPKECFEPQPRVMSSLMVFTPINFDDLPKNMQVIRLLYRYRYMKVKNALKEILIKLLSITQRQAREIVNSFDIDSNIMDKLFDELSSEEVNQLIDRINLK